MPLDLLLGNDSSHGANIAKEHLRLVLSDPISLRVSDAQRRVARIGTLGAPVTGPYMGLDRVKAPRMSPSW
jgi:hypothetical protein